MKVEFIAVDNVQTLPPEPTTNIRLTRSVVKKIESNISSVRKRNSVVKAKQGPFNCSVCKVSFPTKKAYELHKKNDHNDGKYECNDTGKLTNHVRKHEGKADESERYQCSICQACFMDYNDLDSHVRLHFDLDIRYKCTICEASFFDIDRLVKHTGVVHSTSQITFNCYACGNLFASIDEFVKHDQEHKKDSGFLNCSECGETFSSLISLNSHKKTHAIPRTQPYACPKCSLRFSRSEDLHNHIRVHDGKSIYCCALCDRMFAHSKNLTNHVHKSHKLCFAADEMDLIDFVVEAEVLAQVDQKKLEKCLSDGGDSDQVDGDVFRLNVRELVSKYMKKEIPSTIPSLPLQSTNELPTNVTRRFTNIFRKYKCPLCQLVFVKAKTLEIHCKRNHFGNYTLDQLKDIQLAVDQHSTQSFPRAILNCRPGAVQRHECPSCNQMYESRVELIGHLKVDHNGDTPYKCFECSDTFSTSNDLVVHVLNHPDKRHECKYCGLTFMNLYSLGKHTKRHEGNFGHFGLSVTTRSVKLLL